MSKAIGHSVPMSLGRRVVGDFLHASKKMPLVTVQKDMMVARVVAARKRAEPRPSWCSIFTKAYAKVVAQTPELRRVVLTVPWERMFEYSATSADIVMEAPVAGENVLFNVPIRHPESCPLLEIDNTLHWCKEKPVERLRRARHALQLARWPRRLRRLVWWYLLNVSARQRAHYFSTFGVTSVANWGVESLRPLAPWTSLLHYGVIHADGSVSVRLTYDHRILDGSGPSKALAAMEEFLQTELVTELRTLNDTELDSNILTMPQRPARGAA